MINMKLKELVAEINNLAQESGFEATCEYTTGERARLDLVILKNGEKRLAIEFEKTYKWIQQRILYNSVKAHRAGFRKIVFIYPFNQKAIHSSWVLKFVKEELKMDIKIVHPEDCLDVIGGYLSQPTTLTP